jgi:hypothetical protein
MAGRRLLLVLAWVAAAFAICESASACGICFTLGNDGLALPHPKAIEIAVATRVALDKGLIRLPPGSQSGWNLREKLQGPALMDRWSEKVKALPTQKRGETVSFHVVLIDSCEAFVVHVRGGTMVCVPGKMERGQTGLATTSITLAALLDGRLEWAQAVKLRLLQVEGNESDLGPSASMLFTMSRSLDK